MERKLILDWALRVAGFLDNNTILDRGMRPRAFIKGKRMYDLKGSYLGVYDDGVIRDENFKTVSFVWGSSPGIWSELSFDEFLDRK